MTTDEIAWTKSRDYRPQTGIIIAKCSYLFDKND
jgi:hypothetical protein